MYAHIKIERIQPAINIKLLVMSQICGLGKPFKNRAWVCRIDGLDEKFGLKRVFLRPASTDYSKSNSVGSRGVYLNFLLEYNKIYEVSSPDSWKSTSRYFIKVTEDGKNEIKKDEVIAGFKNSTGN